MAARRDILVLAIEALPLLLGAYAAARCWSASRRVPERRDAWALLALACALGPLGAVAGLYVGMAASVAVLLAAAQFARGCWRGARPEQAFDAALAAILIVAVGAWYVAIPGATQGDLVLTAVFLIDVAALLAVSAAAIGRLPGRTGIALVVGAVALAAGDGLAALAAAGRAGDPRIAVALIWAVCALVFARGAGSDGRSAPIPSLPADSWPWARALFPLPIVIALASLGVLDLVTNGVRLVPIAYFALTSTAALVLGFARQAYLVVENRRVAERERQARADATRRKADLEALTGLAATMTEGFDEDTIIERGLEVLRLGAHASSAELRLTRDGELELRGASGEPGRSDARDVIRLALRGRDGVLGFVTLVRGGGYEQADRKLLRLLVGQLAMALQNARDYREKLEQAIRDPLTGLYNRRFFYEAVEMEVQRQRRYRSSASLVLIDVDDFKHINDRHGHAAGDKALCRLAGSVERLIRPSDTFARLGGEEFGLLLPETEPLDALLVAERIRSAIARRELLPGAKVRISAGISSCPTDGDTVAVLEKRADQALYWAKRNGKNLCALATEVVISDDDGAGQHAVANLYSLVGMVDTRLGRGDHSENVASYATAIGKAMGVDKERMVALRRAALLHDIGKVTVGDDDELTETSHHPVVGSLILRHAGLVEEARWVRHHHERVDGEGHPDGLRAEKIPLEARILAVADALDGLGDAGPVALEELRAKAGTWYDRDVVATVCGLAASGELGQPASIAA